MQSTRWWWEWGTDGGLGEGSSSEFQGRRQCDESRNVDVPVELWRSRQKAGSLRLRSGQALAPASRPLGMTDVKVSQKSGRVRGGYRGPSTAVLLRCREAKSSLRMTTDAQD